MVFQVSVSASNFIIFSGSSKSVLSAMGQQVLTAFRVPFRDAQPAKKQAIGMEWNIQRTGIPENSVPEPVSLFLHQFINISCFCKSLKAPVGIGRD